MGGVVSGHSPPLGTRLMRAQGTPTSGPRRGPPHPHSHLKPAGELGRVDDARDVGRVRLQQVGHLGVPHPTRPGRALLGAAWRPGRPGALPPSPSLPEERSPGEELSRQESRQEPVVHDRRGPSRRGRLRLTRLGFALGLRQIRHNDYPRGLLRNLKMYIGEKHMHRRVNRSFERRDVDGWVRVWRGAVRISGEQRFPCYRGPHRLPSQRLAKVVMSKGPHSASVDIWLRGTMRVMTGSDGNWRVLTFEEVSRGV
ncbi:hypothetical protein GW17_00025940 [Ensete ventricosum]|nr:hypothetical protein GW17_00025940 [Ensete ventricosum]